MSRDTRAGSALVFGLSYPQLGEHNRLCPNGCENTSGGRGRRR
jgi:hypothetical protein